MMTTDRCRLDVSYAVQTMLLALLLVGSTCGIAFAQFLANVGGVITDESGARLPGVTVTVINRASGAAQILVTGPEGNYRAVALQPAPYDIKAELAGFGPQQRTITLTVGANATVDFKLAIAAMQENVTVNASAPMVEVAKPELSSVVVSDQVSSLPNLGRNFIEMAQLLPGAAVDNSPAQYYNYTKFGGVADQRNGFTTVVDGGSIDDAIWGTTTVNFTQEAVQEFRVLRNQFDAEYGNALSAFVSVVSKSGTNQFGGTAMYFGRDQALEAKNHFATTKPPFSQKRTGGSFGGPIVKDKTHFFAAFEYNRVNTSQIIALSPTNPFAASENGVFPSGTTNSMFDSKVDHRFNDRHSLNVRYFYDNQYLKRTQTQITSDSNQTDDFSRTHSLIGDEHWILSQKAVNDFRVHYYYQNVGNTTYSEAVGIARPSVTTGSPSYFPQSFPRHATVVHDTMYFNLPRHDIKVGGELALAKTGFDSHVYEHGLFTFGTDAPFDQNDPSTWPLYFSVANPGFFTYSSKQIAAFADDTWRLGSNVRLNLGVRYDLDTNLRDNDFYDTLLGNPTWSGLDHWVSRTRGNDYSAIQPRLGFTWDMKGTGNLVMRGGLGRYVTRNRPWFQVYAESSFLSNTVTIYDPQLLKNFPNISAVLGGKSVDAYVAAGGDKSPFVIGNDSVLPHSWNGTFGVGWQINSVSGLDVDYIHDYGADQLGSTDRNLPSAGPISDTNPRPVAGYSQVLVMENFTKSWYDALETQFRTRAKNLDNLMISYTLSRTYRDGVDFYGNLRGTQRTPHEAGYNNTDQRHILAISGATSLPKGFQISLIGKFSSGSPMGTLQTGFDLDGDGAIEGDRPAGLPITVGRGNVDAQYEIINNFRASQGLPPIPRSFLNLDPFVSIDGRITKVIRLGGTQRVDLFFEGYNLTNHVNFTPFTVGGATFCCISMNVPDFLVREGARPGRQAQWGVRYTF